MRRREDPMLTPHRMRINRPGQGLVDPRALLGRLIPAPWRVLFISVAMLSSGCGELRLLAKACNAEHPCPSDLACVDLDAEGEGRCLTESDNALGSPCLADVACASGFCSDGVCCSERCPESLLCGEGGVCRTTGCGGQPDGTGCTLTVGAQAGVCRSSECVVSSCGDGLTNAATGEACDTAGESASCDADCTLPECGDRVINGARLEVCDDGNTSTETQCPYGTESCDGLYCTADCGAQIIGLDTSFCGDGIRDEAQEDCDDGNVTDDGNGCSIDCRCDDGNAQAGDGCDGGTLEPMWRCHPLLAGCALVRTANACSVLSLPDFTPCEVDTSMAEARPDRSYDICIGGVCRSPGCNDASCNEPGPSVPVADSSQRTCHDSTTEIPCATLPCDTDGGPAFCGQDAQYGWDTLNASTERFSRFEGSPDEAVVDDNVTGLQWQGCSAGRSTMSCLGDEHAMPWQQAVEYCDGLTWGGFEDWRLPDRFTLRTILDHGIPTGASGPISLDPVAFPGESPSYFWSSSSDDFGEFGFTRAYWVRFERGQVSYAGKNNPLGVRCIRGTAVPPASRFVSVEPIADEPVVHDSWTGLVWQGCAAGLSTATCTGIFSNLSWQQALAYCEGLDWGDRSDWRLPSIAEFDSIVDIRSMAQAAAAPYFVGTPIGKFWSSTTSMHGQPNAMSIGFNPGNAERGWVYAADAKAALFRVRCVSDDL